MARSATTHFQPTIDTFGELTVHARRLGTRFMATDWTGVAGNIDRRALTNQLIGLAFLLTFLSLIAGIVIFDRTVFTGTQQPTELYYGGIPLDYD